MRLKRDKTCSAVAGYLSLDITVIEIVLHCPRPLRAESAQMLSKSLWSCALHSSSTNGKFTANGPAPISILFRVQACWRAGLLFLRQRRQDLDGLERGTPSFPTVEQKGWKELVLDRA